MAALVASAAMPSTGDESARWSAFIGAYGAPAWGVIDPTTPAGRFFVDGGVPYFEADEEGLLVRHRLVEVEPEIFLADNGETLDLAGSIPTWRGLRLVRLSGGPAPWQWSILVMAAVLAVTWLVAAAVRTLGRSRSRSRSTREPSSTRRERRIAAAVGGFTAVPTPQGAGVPSCTTVPTPRMRSGRSFTHRSWSRSSRERPQLSRGSSSETTSTPTGRVDGPLTEDLPHRATGPNGRTRARIAEALLEAHEAGRIQATIGRGWDFFGPHAHLSTVGGSSPERSRGSPPRCWAIPTSPIP